MPADAGPARGRPGINPPASFVAFSTLPAAAALPQQPTTDLSWPQRMQPATDTQSQSAHAAAQLLDALGSIPAAAAGLPVPFILPSSPSARQHASSELLTEQAAPHQPPAVDPAAHAPALATNGHQLGARVSKMDQPYSTCNWTTGSRSAIVCLIMAAKPEALEHGRRMLGRVTHSRPGLTCPSCQAYSCGVCSLGLPSGKLSHACLQRSSGTLMGNAWRQG